MPTKTKNQPKTDTAPTAAELYEKGRRIVAGEKPSQKVSKIDPAAAPKPLLCEWQEKIADAVSEMITTGSTDENLTKIIGSVIDHDYRKRFGFGPDESQYLRFSRPIEEQIDSALKELVQHQVTRRVIDAGPERDFANVVQRIRETARQACASDLQEFLNNASPEEHRFWSIIMLNWRSAHTLGGGNGEDMGIASAFQEEIDRNQLYMRIPEQFFNDTWDYVRLLMKAKPAKEEAA